MFLFCGTNGFISKVLLYWTYLSISALFIYKSCFFDEKAESKFALFKNSEVLNAFLSN